MAHALKSTRNHNLAQLGLTAFNVLKKIGGSVAGVFTAIAVAQSRSVELDRMNNLTDVELATRYGINRDQIVAYVFRDRMF